MLEHHVLLVHGLGIFSHDIASSDLWGSLPDRLREQGITVWFATQDAFGGVESNAHQVAQSLRQVCEKTNSQKIHVVAHSKGGLDTRAAFAFENDIVEHVASFVTLASPHNGLKFVDWLSKSRFIMPHIVIPYFNSLAHRNGDVSPDSRQVIEDLSTKGVKCLAQRFGSENYSFPCISYGFITPPAKGKRRFDVLRLLVKHFDGQCDGLVPLWSTEFKQWIVVHVEGVRDFGHIDSTDRHRLHVQLVMPNGKVLESIPDLVIDTLQHIEANSYKDLYQNISDNN